MLPLCYPNVKGILPRGLQAAGFKLQAQCRMEHRLITGSALLAIKYLFIQLILYSQLVCIHISINNSRIPKYITSQGLQLAAYSLQLTPTVVVSQTTLPVLHPMLLGHPFLLL